MMRAVPRTWIVGVVCALALCGAAVGQQEAPTLGGIWVGQNVAVPGNPGWAVTLTVVVEGDAVRGVWEWIDLASRAQTFTAIEGTWDAVRREALVHHRVLFEDMGPSRATAVGSDLLRLQPGDPRMAWGTNDGSSGLRGATCLIKVGEVGDVAGLAGRWQSTPTLMNTPVCLSLWDDAGGCSGTGTALDRDTAEVRPLSASARPRDGVEDEWDLTLVVGEDPAEPVPCLAELDATRCLLRLTEPDGTQTVLVRRGPAVEADEPDAAPAAQPVTGAGWQGEVVGIADGDTLTVLRDGRTQVKVRLWGVDAPESKQPWGSRSKEGLSALVFGKTVRVEEKDIDRYGRTVAEVFMPDGRSANEEQLRAGLAWWYAYYAKAETRFEKLQDEAVAAKRGLWGDNAPVPPWDWRNG